jgi:hypothetical protein
MRGDSMTKTLQEIQQENRRLIMQIVHSCNFDKKAGYELDKLFEAITLSRVLLVLAKFEKIMQIIPQNAGKIDIYLYKRDFFSWDLTKPLGEDLELEEQSEATQRAIYELLGGENE